MLYNHACVHTLVMHQHHAIDSQAVTEQMCIRYCRDTSNKTSYNAVCNTCLMGHVGAHVSAVSDTHLLSHRQSNAYSTD